MFTDGHVHSVALDEKVEAVVSEWLSIDAAVSHAVLLTKGEKPLLRELLGLLFDRAAALEAGRGRRARRGSPTPLRGERRARLELGGAAFWGRFSRSAGVPGDSRRRTTRRLARRPQAQSVVSRRLYARTLGF